MRRAAALLFVLPLLSAPAVAQSAGGPFTVKETGQSFSRLQDAVFAIGDRSGTITIAPGTYRDCAVQEHGRIAGAGLGAVAHHRGALAAAPGALDAQDGGHVPRIGRALDPAQLQQFDVAGLDAVAARPAAQPSLVVDLDILDEPARTEVVEDLHEGHVPGGGPGDDATLVEAGIAQRPTAFSSCALFIFDRPSIPLRRASS